MTVFFSIAISVFLELNATKIMPSNNIVAYLYFMTICSTNRMDRSKKLRKKPNERCTTQTVITTKRMAKSKNKFFV